MHISTQIFWLPKKGNSIDEYEDAAAPIDPVDAELESFRCAIADGATETSFSGRWANLLVKHYVAQDSIQTARTSWKEALPTEDVPWYVEQKANSGAFAALAGLTLTDDELWHAEAVGDSCIIQTRDFEKIASMPLDNAESFNNRPVLLCSLQDEVDEPEKSVLDGTWQSGDRFFLVTDALAHWLLSDIKANAPKLWQVESLESFTELVAKERDEKGDDGRPKLHNDDVTVIKLEVS